MKKQKNNKKKVMKTLAGASILGASSIFMTGCFIDDMNSHIMYGVVEPIDKSAIVDNISSFFDVEKNMGIEAYGVPSIITNNLGNDKI